MGKYWFKFMVNGCVRETTVDAVGEPAAWRIVENMYPNDKVLFLNGARADQSCGRDRIAYERKKMGLLKK